MQRSLLLLLVGLLWIGCSGSEFTPTAPGGQGAACSKSTECAMGLRCLQKSPDVESTCSKDCDSSASCGTGFLCVDTDLGTERKPVCVTACSMQSQCVAGWTCNGSTGACEPK